MTAIDIIKRQLDEQVEQLTAGAKKSVKEAIEHAVRETIVDVLDDPIGTAIFTMCESYVENVVDNAKSADWDIHENDGQLIISLGLFPLEDNGYLKLRLDSWIDDDCDLDDLLNLQQVLDAFMPRLLKRIAEKSS